MGSGRSEELKGKAEFWKKSYNPPEARKAPGPGCPVPRQMRGRRAWPGSPNTSHSALLTNRRDLIPEGASTPLQEAGWGTGGPGTPQASHAEKAAGRLRVRSAWGHKEQATRMPHWQHKRGRGDWTRLVLFPGPMCLQGAQSKTLFCKLRSKASRTRPQPRVLTAGRPEFQSGQGA